MTIAYDGSHYWNGSGGGDWGVRLAELDASGALLNYYSPGLDLRSVFTDSNGDVYARTYNSGTIYKQTSPGAFTGWVTLAGSLDDQSSVVLNGSGTEYIAMESGVVRRWDLSGNFLGTVSLSGWGLGGENNYPANRGIAAAGDLWLTYADGILSAWNQAGNRVDQTTLNGAGTGFNSHFSFSDANSMVFVADGGPGAGNWKGYRLSFSTPDGGVTAAMLGTAFLVLGACARSRREGQIDVTNR